jgi:basic amino acid/polyamine antiporter, APA family
MVVERIRGRISYAFILPAFCLQPTAPRPNTKLLDRHLGLVSATALVISNMVGTGIFTTSGFLAGDLGSPTLFFAIWIVGAVVAMTGALCYAELGINYPASGGEYLYLTRAFGPVWGFMTGWTSFVCGFAGPIAAAALSFGDYLGFFFPVFRQDNAWVVWNFLGWQAQFGGAQILASAVIGCFTLANLFGVARVARLQNALTALKLVVILVFAFLGLSSGNGEWSHFSLHAIRTSTAPLPLQFLTSLFFIYVSYSGWNAATYIAEEIRDPERTLPRAIAFGTLIVAFLFLLLNVVFVYATPLESMKGVVAVGSLAAERLLGAHVGGLFSAMMAVALLATVNAMVTVGPRVCYAMARNGAFPPLAVRVDPQWRTPSNAILLQGIITILITLTPLPSLLIWVGFSLNFFATCTCIALMRLRGNAGWKKISPVSFAWPLMPMIFACTGSAMTVVGLLQQPRIAFSAIAVIGVGALWFRFRMQGRATMESLDN